MANRCAPTLLTPSGTRPAPNLFRSTHASHPPQIASFVTGADGQLPWVALVNAGSVRASIPAGPISQQQITELVPFPNWWAGLL